MSVRLEQENERWYRLEGRCFAATAEWQSDRWQVSIAGVLGEDRQALLTLGTALPGPVFQQCFARPRSDGQGEFLLVGQDARRHFSAVLTLSDVAVRFEAADRGAAAAPVATTGWLLAPAIKSEPLADPTQVRLESQRGQAWCLETLNRKPTTPSQTTGLQTTSYGFLLTPFPSPV